MSLKGYQWLNDNGEVAMAFFFKDRSLCIYQNVSLEEIDKFKKYIEDNGFEIFSTENFIKEDE